MLRCLALKKACGTKKGPIFMEYLLPALIYSDSRCIFIFFPCIPLFLFFVLLPRESLLAL